MKIKDLIRLLNSYDPNLEIAISLRDVGYEYIIVAYPNRTREMIKHIPDEDHKTKNTSSNSFNF